MSIRRRTYEILEGVLAEDPLSRWVNAGIVALITVNLAALVLETVDELQARYGWLFVVIEVVSVALFSLEYGLRLWSIVEEPQHAGAGGRLRYALSPLMMIDLAAIVPIYLGHVPGLHVFFDLRFLRIVRCVRIFRIAKLARYSLAMIVFGRVLAAKKEELVFVLLFMALLILVSATFMYYAEHDDQPEKFASIPAAMWWAVETLTTVGYGDAVPKTVVGKIIASIISLLGIAVFALPAGILGAGFADEWKNLHGPRRCPHCDEPLE
jgi:voltage-gated potassium channel